MKQRRRGRYKFRHDVNNAINDNCYHDCHSWRCYTVCCHQGKKYADLLKHSVHTYIVKVTIYLTGIVDMPQRLLPKQMQTVTNINIIRTHQEMRWQTWTFLRRYRTRASK